MKILWLTNIPSPYRVDFFNELGKYCELTVVFERNSSSERDTSWSEFEANHFTPIMMRGKKIGAAEALCLEVVNQIRKKEYDHIVVTNYSDPTGLLAVATLKMRHIPYEIEGDGAFPGSGNGWREKIKHWAISSATTCFSTSQTHDLYYEKYGAQTENIKRYPFSSIKNQDLLTSPISEEKKKVIRNELSMRERKIILAVGQFIPRKGFDILINAMRLVSGDVGLYIVGGEPTVDYKRIIEQYNIGNVHFCGFKRPSELRAFFDAADLFVHPTREDIWGLVVNEAMARGLPVITTERCGAGMEMINSESIGSIVESENPEQLAERIEYWLTTKGDKTAQIIINRAAEYTVETMVDRHLQIWSVN